MEPKRKLVGYYLSKTGKVLKAYKVLPIFKTISFYYLSKIKYLAFS